MTITFISKTKQVGPINFTPATRELFSFAVNRQSIFFRRRAGITPWTTDEILSIYKFTNAYRVLDRVSQYLVKNVIYKNSYSESQTFYRILLFKIFNKIETWEMLESELGDIIVTEKSLAFIDKLLEKRIKECSIFSGAYIMPSGVRQFGFSKKHKSYILILKMMMQDKLHEKVFQSASLRHVFHLLTQYPLIGPFLGFQFAIDLNYAEFINFSEMDFVVAGPGCIDGISKCFKNLHMSPEDLIEIIAKEQQQMFEYFGLKFDTLGDRPLQLIDWQNLFCETSKYTRVSMPEVEGVAGRKRIKQKFKENKQVIDYYFPPKWNITLPTINVSNIIEDQPNLFP